jgi:hypothetical protein
MASSQLLKSNLTLSKFLINESQLVVLEKNLKAELVPNLIARRFEIRDHRG